MDFLATLGKIASLTLSLTPVPTYFGLWGKTKAEQIKAVQSVSFSYLLLYIINNSIWTSYAF